jgi:excisionase family DNA binding protein
MDDFLSPRDVAVAIGVSESSLKRWIDGGLLQATRTAGGHRRIAVQEVVRFARSRRVPVRRPDVLLGEAGLALRGAPLDGDGLFDLLLRDDRAGVTSVLLGRFLAGEALAALCDGPIRAALERIGDLWKHDERGIVVEHRATDTMLQVLAMLRHLLQVPTREAPLALGGAPGGDPYLLPSLMAATVLADVGFRDANLGANVPAAAFLRAVDDYGPALVWVSVTAADATEVRRLLRGLADRQRARPLPVVVGGRGLDGREMAGVVALHHLGSMTELTGFARALRARGPQAEGGDAPTET